MEPQTVTSVELQAAIKGSPPERSAHMLLQPVAANDHIVEVFRNYQRLKTSLLDESDFQIISNKKFIKKSGWRKLGTAFGISDEIVKEERRVNDKFFTYEVTVKVSAQNGRYAFGVGSCSSTERRFAHPDHDVRATSHTRAKNRAISDLVGFGEVSAEEMGNETDLRVSNVEPASIPHAISARDTQEVSDQDIGGSYLVTERQLALLRKLIAEKAPANEQDELLTAIPKLSRQEASLLIKGMLNGGYWGR